MNCDRLFYKAPGSDGACVSAEDPRGTRHSDASSLRKLACGRTVWILLQLQPDLLYKLAGEVEIAVAPYRLTGTV
jgi:hypothetical protein